MKTFNVQSEYLDMPEAIVVTALYHDGSMAVHLEDAEGQEVVSINLTAYDLHLPIGQFFVKNYSEHEGLAIGLMKAGIATKVGEVTYGPYESSATVLQLNEGVLND